MKSKQRLLSAINRETPDRLPVTTHHVMPYFLKTYMGGISVQEFFDYFQLDPINWVDAYIQDTCSDDWRIEEENIPDSTYKTTRYKIMTPVKTLSMTLQGNEQTDWVTEPLIKEKSDIEVFAKYAPVPLCDVAEVNRQAEEFDERGLIRGTIPGFDIYGQPGCWQDATVLFGIENLIMETFSDPEWVHTFLKIFRDRKKKYVQSMKGAKFDILELGGGSASTTVISPAIFDRFVAPYDAELIELAHQAGQRIVYHTCGGMMPILESIADMNPDAMETFTPQSMGGDIDLKDAKRRIGDRVCMIGGFDQFHYLKDCHPDETRKAVRKCFEEAGERGGYILAPSDHFFDADIECLIAFADEARSCIYQ
ncbi:MAG: uroporphyrinogen decarboxylase family protein [Candidatus Hatepunaea meridiana]|nr:uroporphyrinogen decarboxylase family protein [Candidatus Hatepunaea meridiana]